MIISYQEKWLPAIYSGDLVKFFYLIDHYFNTRLVNEPYPAEEYTEIFKQKHQALMYK